jgi:hypothetical protein
MAYHQHRFIQEEKAARGSPADAKAHSHLQALGFIGKEGPGKAWRIFSLFLSIIDC